MPVTSDVTVVGAGIIGLATATAAARKGLSVKLIGDQRAGEASAAAAGMLAPSVERATGPAHAFDITARDRYPAYVEDLAEQTDPTQPPRHPPAGAHLRGRERSSQNSFGRCGMDWPSSAR